MNKFMKIAVDEACTGVSSGHGAPFGAVIVRDNEIIATGHNMIQANIDPTAHAEVTAIRNACQKLKTLDLSSCVLYTSSFPCSMCLSAALWAGLKTIYFAANLDEAEAAGFEDKIFYDLIKDPKKDKERKLELMQVDNYLKPFQMWTEMNKQ